MSEDAIITLFEAAKRIDPAWPADARALEALCLRAAIWTAKDDDGIRCCRSADLPRIAAELAWWRARPRVWPRRPFGRPVVRVAGLSPFAGRTSPWAAPSRNRSKDPTESACLPKTGPS